MAGSLWFHLVSLAICVLAVSPTPYSSSEQASILSSHNTERGRFKNLPLITWNDKAAQVAQAYANRCIFQHNPDRTNQYASLVGTSIEVGENLYASGGFISGLPRAIDNWVNEKADYNCNANTCTDGKMCGHYTQVIWNGTTTVGCGRAYCDINSPWGQALTSWTSIVCNYATAGNWIGQRPVANCDTSSSNPPPPPPPSPTPTPPTPTPTPTPPTPTPTPPTRTPTPPTPTPTPPTPTPTPPTPTPTPAPSPVDRNLGYRKCFSDPGASHLSYRYWFGSTLGFSLETCQSKCLSKSPFFTSYGFQKDSLWYYCVCYATPPLATQVEDWRCIGQYRDMLLPYTGNADNIAIYTA